MSAANHTSSSQQGFDISQYIPYIFVGAVWTLISAYMGLEGYKWFIPEAASVEAEAVDRLFQFMLFIGTFIFLLVQCCIYFFAVRYGFFRNREDDTDGPPIHGNNTIEIIWTIIPVIIVFLLTITSLQVLIDTTEARDNELEIQTFAQRFFWSFQYPDPDYTLSSNHILVVPKDQVVRLKLDSRDVIHAFWVPEFRIKNDVMPGRTTEVRFTPSVATGLPNNESSEELAASIDELRATIDESQTLIDEIDAAKEAETSLDSICPADEPIAEEASADEETEVIGGVSAGSSDVIEPPVQPENGYPIVCAELCGPSHGVMRGAVYVVEQEEYDAYIERLRLQIQSNQLTQQIATSCGGAKLLEAGRTLFNSYGCNTCHQLFDAGSMNMGAGPSMNGVGSRAAERADYASAYDYIFASIINPNAYVVDTFSPGIMPQNFIDRIPQDELNLLATYLSMMTE